MARKAYGDHATQVNLSTYPDDGTSPVGSAEWNESLDNEGMLGFTPQTSTITISSGVATITDSISVIAAESSTSDTLQKLALANTNEYDLVYLFADTGDTITLEHGDLNADGEISTISGDDETLSTTVPTILMRKGNYRYGYGGGSASGLDTTNFAAATIVIESEGISGNDNDTTLPTSAAVKDYVDTAVLTEDTITELNDTTISGIASGELLKWNGSAWINQTLAEAGIAASGAKLSDFAATSSSELAGTISDEMGSGALVFATSPTLVTPALGTPSAGVLTNCTALPAAQVAQGTMASGTVLVAPVLGTPASGALTNCTALPAAQVAQGTMASGMVLVAPALGTPASGVATNLTGTAANLTAGIATTAVTVSDNAITLAKMAGGTDGNIISYDASGDPVAVATGNSGQVLTSAGAGAPPTFTTISSGFVGTATSDLDMTGAYDIEDVNLLFLEHKSSTYISGGSAASADIADQSQLFVEQIDVNNDALYIRLRLNGSTQNVRLA